MPFHFRGNYIFSFFLKHDSDFDTLLHRYIQRNIDFFKLLTVGLHGNIVHYTFLRVGQSVNLFGPEDNIPLVTDTE